MFFWAEPEEKSLAITLCPEVGYLFSEDWGVGILLGYEHEQRINTVSGQKAVGNAFKFSPFVRYYYLHRLPFNLFVDGGVGFNFSSERRNDSTERRNGFEVGLRPGACIDLTDGLCLCLRMGFVGYRHNYFMGEEPGVGSNGIGLRLAPEELMIGLELEF